ncbi:PH domain-containing protein [Salinactinospora qingdaonensis]|uniref:PH domain-containing protein n=2 Tax=Salinactinospora qingdaonensis TaxID=702744 RepID=A0ABP7EZ89_9ACTN
MLAILVALAWWGSHPRVGWLPGAIEGFAWWIPGLYFAYALLKTAVAPQWRYRVHRWEIAADVVYTRVGWVSRQWQLVPVSRIQTVDHTQGWLERMFNVATLQIQTASHAGSSSIEGLDADLARRLSEDLAVRASELRDDAT